MDGQCCDLTGYPITCSDKEALKLFNEGSFAIVTLRDNGFPMILKALERDKSLILARCVISLVLLEDLRPPTDPNVACHLDAIKDIVNTMGDQLTPREHGYVRAVRVFASGSLLKATEELRNMLIDYPLDVLGYRIVVGFYITLGEYERMRDMSAMAMEFWTEDMEMYPFVLGFYGFALEETRERDLAEVVSKKALAMDKRNAFATHAMSHVIEESREAETGVEFLLSTRDDWKDSVFGGHITWHLALFYFDLGDYSTLLEEFDNVLFERSTADNAFGLLDASSLLWRLSAVGVDVGEKRWKKVTDALATHVDKTLARSPWFDTHIMMGLAHGKVSESTARLALAREMIKKVEGYSQSEGVLYRDISQTLGVPVCNALLAFGQERYDEVLQIMLPLRYDFIRFGGSWAQRQVYNVTMIEAAIRANKLPLALSLVAELKGQKPKSKRLTRLFADLKARFDSQQKVDLSISPKAKKMKVLLNNT